VIRSGGRAPVTIAALPRKSVNREDTMAQQLALLNAFDEPASHLSSQKTGRRPSARALRHPTEGSKKG
jgi:hypothetical protein